jgi:hypothetical protein
LARTPGKRLVMPRVSRTTSGSESEAELVMGGG